MSSPSATLSLAMFLSSKIAPNLPCPCGSGMKAKRCCLALNGSLEPLTPKATKPPGPPTGFSHPRCFARPLRDCCDELTREHFVSQAVLKHFDAEATVAGGFRWQPAPETDVVPDQLSAKVLCKRHNNALDPLDTAAGRLFGILASDLRRDEYVYTSGDDLERWALKLICGTYAASIAARLGEVPARDRLIPLPWLESLFTKTPLQAPLGLYFCPERKPRTDGGTILWVRNLFSSDGLPAGIELHFAVIDFLLVLDPVILVANPMPGGWGQYRHHWRMHFLSDGLRRTIEFSWQSGHNGQEAVALGKPEVPVDDSRDIKALRDAITRQFEKRRSKEGASGDAGCAGNHAGGPQPEQRRR